MPGTKRTASKLPDEPEGPAESEDLLENGDDLPLEMDDISEEAVA